MNTSTLPHRCRGFTLLEVLAVLGIVATLLSQALGALGQFREEQLLRARAQALADDLRFTRSEAARTGDPVFFRISGKGANACYIIHTGAAGACDCANGKAACTAAGASVIRTEWFASTQPLRIKANAETMEFQRVQGLVTQTGTIELSLDSGRSIRQIVAITGRVRGCTLGMNLRGMSRCA